MDLLVLGPLHTLDPARPHAQAALIRAGRFARVGTHDECAQLAGPEVRVVEVEGCAVPGLIDAHGHPFLHGRSLVEVSCAGARSEEECVARVAKAASSAGPGEWIRGQAWDQNEWPGARFPTQARLSAAVPAQPVSLARIDVHALWCNARAFELAGIDSQTPDPPGGKILRGADGGATGVLIDNAMDLVRRAMPALDQGRAAEETILRSLRALVQLGLTAVHDASCGPERLELYRRLAEEGSLPLRIYAMIDGQGPLEELGETMKRWAQTPTVGRLTVRSVKLFADGALGSRGAAMFDPYEDDSGNTGLWLMEPGDLAERIALVAREGYQPSVHCIGDKACAEVLQNFSQISIALRPRAEHLQILRTRDAALLKRSGAIASMQPVHAASDGAWAEARLGRGTERQRGAYAWRQALESGAQLAFGSDFPVESPDPRLGLRAAISRKTSTGAVWMPEQRIGRLEALRAFTLGAAYAEFAEGRRGMIREGYDADLTVLGQDLFEVPADELAGVPIVATVVGGLVEHAGA